MKLMRKLRSGGRAAASSASSAIGAPRVGIPSRLFESFLRVCVFEQERTVSVSTSLAEHDP